jgi:hypothetical protein
VAVPPPPSPVPFTAPSFRVVDVPRTVYGGSVTFAYAAAPALLPAYSAACASAPNHLTLHLLCTHDAAGAKVLVVVVAMVGNADDAEALLAPLLACAPPLTVALAEMPLHKLVDGNDHLLRQRARGPLAHHWRSLQFKDVEDVDGGSEVDAAALQAACDAMPADCMLYIEQLGGAYRGVRTRSGSVGSAHGSAHGSGGGSGGSDGAGEPAVAFRRSPFLLYVIGRFEPESGPAALVSPPAAAAAPGGSASSGGSGGGGGGGGGGSGSGSGSGAASAAAVEREGGAAPTRAAVLAWVRAAASAFVLYVNRPLCACNTGVDSPEAVWGSLAPALRAAKRRYDPENFFRRTPTNIPTV